MKAFQLAAEHYGVSQTYPSAGNNDYHCENVGYQVVERSKPAASEFLQSCLASGQLRVVLDSHAMGNKTFTLDMLKGPATDVESAYSAQRITESPYSVPTSFRYFIPSKLTERTPL